MATSKTEKGQQNQSVTKKSITKKGTIKKGAIKKTGSTKKPPNNNSEHSSSIGKPAHNSATGVKVVSGIISWVALLFSVLALCAGGYAWYLTAVDSRLNVSQQENRFNTLEQRLGSFDVVHSDTALQIGQLKNRIKTHQEEIVEQQAALREQVSTNERVSNAQTDRFRRKFNTLSDSILKLGSELGHGMERWTLEEAEQLIFIANQRVQFAGQFDVDSNLAKHALRYADERLQMLANPELNGVRQLLTAEITALDNVPVIDTVGVLNKLSSLSSTVEQLAFAGDLVIPENANTKVASGASSDSSETGAAAAVNTAAVNPEAEASVISRYTQPIIDAGASLLVGLGNLIQVEKKGESIKSVISAEVRQMTYQKTKLILEAAQIAFIRRQPELYQNRIQSARSWAMENFDQNSQQTINWLEQLYEVGSISPKAKIPDISGSLKALRAFIKNAN